MLVSNPGLIVVYNRVWPTISVQVDIFTDSLRSNFALIDVVGRCAWLLYVAQCSKTTDLEC